MADTYVFIIREQDWDSDQFLDRPRTDPGSAENKFPEHAAFAVAVEKLGATITGGAALQNLKYGGSVTPGEKGREVEDAVWTDAAYADTSEVITGFYMVEVDRRGPGPSDRGDGPDRQPHRVAQGLPDGGVTPILRSGPAVAAALLWSEWGHAADPERVPGGVAAHRAGAGLLHREPRRRGGVRRRGGRPRGRPRGPGRRAGRVVHHRRQAGLARRGAPPQRA